MGTNWNVVIRHITYVFKNATELFPNSSVTKLILYIAKPPRFSVSLKVNENNFI
jgi:hypothetical protein